MLSSLTQNQLFLGNKLQQFVSALGKRLYSIPAWKLAFGNTTCGTRQHLTTEWGAFGQATPYSRPGQKLGLKKPHTKDNDVEPTDSSSVLSFFGDGCLC